MGLVKQKFARTLRCLSKYAPLDRVRKFFAKVTLTVAEFTWQMEVNERTHSKTVSLPFHCKFQRNWRKRPSLLTYALRSLAA